MKRQALKKLILSSLFLALGYVLPLLTGQIPAVGKALLPMHVPVLLCGFICGGPWGLLVGAVLPLTRALLFGMPPIYPTALAMTFELAAYGFFAGFFYRLFRRGTAAIFLALPAAMIVGRLLWGAASAFLYGVGGKTFTLAMFWAGAVANAVPGIVLQLVLVPAVLLALTRAKLIPLEGQMPRSGEKKRPTKRPRNAPTTANRPPRNDRPPATSKRQPKTAVFSYRCGTFCQSRKRVRPCALSSRRSPCGRRDSPPTVVRLEIYKLFTCAHAHARAKYDIICYNLVCVGSHYAKISNNIRRTTMVKSSFAAKTVALVLAALLCAACLLTLAACKKKGGNEVDVENGADAAVTNRETDGQKYTFDSDCELFVLIGVDEGSCTDPDGHELGGGRANAVFVASANTRTQKIDLIQLDQNTMVEMKTFDRWGLSAGKTVAQLSLAYAYGDGDTESALNVVGAVKALTGLPVDSYVTINSAAMADLVRLSGAVTVTTDDGNVTLTTADQFQDFLREQGFGIKANEKRMARMRAFVPAFFSALKAANAEPSALGNNIKSNIAVGEKFAAYKSYELNTPVKALEGQSQLVGDFVEFTVNEESMIRLLNGICYKKEG